MLRSSALVVLLCGLYDSSAFQFYAPNARTTQQQYLTPCSSHSPWVQGWRRKDRRIQRPRLMASTTFSDTVDNEEETTISNNEQLLARYNQQLVQFSQNKDYTSAEHVVTSMIADGIRPGVSHYYHVLHAYGDSMSHAARAETIVNHLASTYRHTGTVAYNLVLKICKNNSQTELERAERMWRMAVEQNMADEITYATFAGILANQENTRESAQRILDLIASADATNSSDADASNNNSSTSTTINAQTWNNAMHAFLKGGDMDQAENILRLLEDNFIRNKEDGNSDGTALAPTVASYTILIDGYAKRNALEKAQDVFDSMQTMYHLHGNVEARPNAYPYVTLIHMYARQRGRPECALQAQTILFDMFQRYQQNTDGDKQLKPNTQLITSCLDAWQRSGAPNCGERGEAILNWMLEQAETDTDFLPNEYTFCSAITAWAKSRQIGKPIRARNILNIMLDLHQKGKLRSPPDSVCYTAVINACAYCAKEDLEKATALRIAVTTYKEMTAGNNAIQPSPITYATFLTALQHLVPKGPKRTNAARDVFQTAKDLGFVDYKVVNRLKSCVPREELGDLLPEALVTKAHIHQEAIPEEWRKNIES